MNTLQDTARQAFRFKLYQHKRNRHLHQVIDVAAGAWNHAVALHRLFGKTLPKAKLQSHLAKLRQTTRQELAGAQQPNTSADLRPSLLGLAGVL
jgi:hypothetical protein